MTEATGKQRAKDILTRYLALNKHRKTAERYAILDTVYDTEGHFTLDELSSLLAVQNFRVSRATLYNTMKLFIELRLVVRHRFIGQTKYEACRHEDNHVHQVCTTCGRVTELDSKPITEAIEATRLKRFHRDGFMLYLYGVCSQCQARITREQNKRNKAREQEKNKTQEKDKSKTNRSKTPQAQNKKNKQKQDKK